MIDYLYAVKLDNRKNFVKTAIEILDKHKGQFDSIAFRGYSGALVAPYIADAFQKNLVAVRAGKNSHSNLNCEYAGLVGKYIIVDDFIGSGGTINAIVDVLGENIYGVYTYKQGSCVKEATFKYTEKHEPFTRIEIPMIREHTTVESIDECYQKILNRHKTNVPAKIPTEPLNKISKEFKKLQESLEKTSITCAKVSNAGKQLEISLKK